ncbi:MAG TPA: DUF1684 domain-containing protein [Polyangia bacterium]|nr:DUF1684 domain-containing protein [Polyangia bacterium]
MSVEPFAYERGAHERSVELWRSGRLARLTAPDGWLSLVARVPLEDGDNRVGSAEDLAIALPRGRAPADVGVFQRVGKSVSFTPAAGLALSVRGRGGTRALEAGVATPLRTDHDGAPDKVVVGDLTMEIAEHPDGFFVRVRDPESDTRRTFTGIEHFPIDPKFRVVAKLERYEPPKAVDLGYEAGSTETYLSPGAAVFEIDGVQCRVEPVIDGDRGRLYLVFWDPTGRDSTYGAGRFLYAPMPDGDRVLLDFNLAFSPPCAFTPYAACPLAPSQNRLKVRIEAGEKYTPGY